MKIEELEPSEYGPPGGWKLSGWTSIDELLSFRDEQRQLVPDRQLLFVLDNFEQACYTSMHIVSATQLARPDKAEMTADELDAYNYKGMLSPQRWAKAVVGNLQSLAVESDLASATGRLLPIDAEETKLVELYGKLEKVFVEPLRCLSIKTTDPSAAIAAKPNGLLSCASTFGLVNDP